MLSEFVHQSNCKNYKIITDLSTGERACYNCGSVFNEKPIDVSSENIGSTKEFSLKTSRTGSKISLKMADMGLSTIMESKNVDSSGKSLSYENRRIFYRLRMWDRNSRYANTSQSYQKAFLILDGLRTKLSLPDYVIEESAYLFRKISSKKMLSGRSTLGIICATGYIACRLTGTPRSLADFSSIGNIKRKNLQRIYRFIVRELGINPTAYYPHDFVSRISKKIKVHEKTERCAFRIVSLAEKKGISTSKNPMSIAAAAVNLAVLKNKEKVSQAKISHASGISAVTIRDRLKEIKKKLGDEI